MYEYGITPDSEFDKIKKRPPRSGGTGKNEGGRKGGRPSLLSQVFGRKEAARTDPGIGSAWTNTPNKLSDYLPDEDTWWRLYLNPEDHDEAQSESPDDPGLAYDKQSSPGYQLGMVESYRKFLDVDMDKSIDHKEYFAMRDTATEHLTESARARARKPAEGRFPLSKNPVVKKWKRSPSSRPNVATDLKGETLAGRYVIDDSGKRTKAPRGSTNYLTRTEIAADGAQKYKYIHPAYGVNFDKNNPDIESAEAAFVKANTPEVADLVDAAMARYEEEVDAAPNDPDNVLRAIGRAIRVLHVVHPFEDGNGRLNIHLLLPRLLLRHGFPPVVPANMSVLFNGTFTADEIVEHLKTAIRNGPKRPE